MTRARVRVTHAIDRIFDRLRHPTAFTLDEDVAEDGDLCRLRGYRYAVLVTYRRSGEPVPSPVWFGVDAAGRVYVKTTVHAGKVQRLRREARALLAPSDVRGKPQGPVLRAKGRVLPPDEWPAAEATIAAGYGAGRALSERLLAGDRSTWAYLELTSR